MVAKFVDRSFKSQSLLPSRVEQTIVFQQPSSLFKGAKRWHGQKEKSIITKENIYHLLVRRAVFNVGYVAIIQIMLIDIIQVRPEFYPCDL